MTTTNKTQKTIECPRCSGNKTIDAFYHVANGRCFLCCGTGVVSVPSLKANKNVKKNVSVFNIREYVRDNSGAVLDIKFSFQVSVVFSIEHSKGSDSIAVFGHKMIFADTQKDAHKRAMNLRDKIKEADLSMEHLMDSPHWIRS